MGRDSNETELEPISDTTLVGRCNDSAWELVCQRANLLSIRSSGIVEHIIEDSCSQLILPDQGDRKMNRCMWVIVTLTLSVLSCNLSAIAAEEKKCRLTLSSRPEVGLEIYIDGVTKGLQT